LEHIFSIWQAYFYIQVFLPADPLLGTKTKPRKSVNSPLANLSDSTGQFFAWNS
jgi:hypothetical protein